MTTPRRCVGVLLLLHGLAHILPGMQVATATHWWIGGESWFAALARWLLVVVLWGLAAVGMTAAGLGLLGVPAFRHQWRRYLTAGVLGSLVLLGLAWRAPLAIPGIALDILLLGWVIRPRVDDAPEARHTRRLRQRVGALLGMMHIVTLTLLIMVYPWHRRWGSSEAELIGAQPGDTPMAQPTYLVQHAVTIDAPAWAVWPWLVQLGEDRGGFYSYAWLENLFGLGIRNADRIHPEWQRLVAGDSVFATPKGWLGLDQRLGWRVSQLEAERVIVLENWGAFILRPESPNRTRLIVRTRGAGPARIADLLFAPMGFLVFEPAHFIMERKMLLEVKARAERLQGVAPIICGRTADEGTQPPGCPAT